MKSNIRRWVVGVATVLSMAGLITGMVGAQANKAANGFRISPVRSEFTIEKGKSQALVVTIENPTNVATVAKPVVNDFVSSDKEDGEPRLILDDNSQPPKNSIKKLIQPISDVSLGPKEKKDITVNIQVPADANAGGYYGAIRFIPSATGAEQPSNVGLTASVGTIVLVRVPGNLTERLDLVQLSAEQNGKAKSFFTGGSIGVLTRLKNSGDIHVKPFGRVEVKDMFGKVVATYEFNNVEPRANILPDSIRRFDNQLANKHWFGRYTIEANLGYTQGSGELITAKTSFWYIPTWGLIVILLVLLAIAGSVYWFLKKRGNRAHHKPKKS